jgi:hypothetical protein
MSDLPRGYLRCQTCSATFPAKSDEGKDIERCPGCGRSVESIRVKTKRYIMRLAGVGAPRPMSLFERFAPLAAGVIVLVAAALSIYLLKFRTGS